MCVYSCLTANIRSIFSCSNGIYNSKRIILIVCMYRRTFIGKEINVPFQCKGIRQLITYVRTIHHIKKLTFYAHCISTGTGGGYVLWTGVVQVRIRAWRRPYCPTEDEARRFRTSVGSGNNVDRTEKRKL